ncbi:Acetyl-CoA synthetase-like protein [Mycena indigotica]|uniref:Acetyl-CoA synthetase-like protein n=1 Tax=Mycena indigotica TaxID=2126181 RepID=A0A8H6SW50_9AGAR|nr:Acetyl-CoA synthetase-like protein [Mycena indigotica]KAF7307018.1 Acetyl-CoA synthetase-like protein [Mycena indigotica]
MALKTHLTVLQETARRAPSSVAFKLPRADSQSTYAHDWYSVTYQQFLHDVELFARHWLSVLSSNGVAPGSVVSLWLGGYGYADVLNIYAISRAGFIPQLFSLRLPSPEVVFELILSSGSKSIIYEPAFSDVLKACPVPTYLALVPETVSVVDCTLPPLPNPTADGIAFFFHTSGSTGGSPKLVPCTYRWLDSMVSKSYQVSQPLHSSRQDVTVWMGSMCHIGQSFMLIGSLQHGSCVIQPSTISFSAQELAAMIQRCGLNRLNQFAAFLANHLRAARQDAKLLSLLCSLDQVLTSGMPLAREEEDWAYANGIKLKNLFGSTEAGGMLTSIGGSGGDARLLVPLEGTAYAFIPIEGDSTAIHQSTGRMLEFVILAESRDCPHSSLRHGDGNFHTGDLFQEVAPGRYLSCGRNDDWIKSENSLRCDTKSIEDNARMMCGELIAECIVVGSGRPSPVLFVEPGTDMDHEKLKKEIIRQTRLFHSRRYLHERITSSKHIVVVPPKTLPRTLTKGNIRRGAVETQYKTLLDGIFAC